MSLCGGAASAASCCCSVGAGWRFVRNCRLRLVCSSGSERCDCSSFHPSGGTCWTGLPSWSMGPIPEGRLPRASRACGGASLCLGAGSVGGGMGFFSGSSPTSTSPESKDVRGPRVDAPPSVPSGRPSWPSSLAWELTIVSALTKVPDPRRLRPSSCWRDDVGSVGSEGPGCPDRVTMGSSSSSSSSEKRSLALRA